MPVSKSGMAPRTSGKHSRNYKVMVRTHCLWSSPCVLQQSKDMQVMWNGDCKLPTGINASVNGCLSFYVSPVVSSTPATLTG